MGERAGGEWVPFRRAGVEPGHRPGGPVRESGDSRGIPPPVLFFARQKENEPRPVQEKKRWNGQAGPPVRGTGVVRIGAVGLDGPVVPAPGPGGQRAASPHNDPGGWAGWLSDFPLLLSPRVPLYPQGVRRIRRAAEPPAAAQLLRAAGVVAACPVRADGGSPAAGDFPEMPRPLGEGGRRRRTDERAVRPPHAAHRGGRASGASSPFILSIRYLFFPKAPLRGQPCRSHPR